MTSGSLSSERDLFTTTTARSAKPSVPRTLSIASTIVPSPSSTVSTNATRSALRRRSSLARSSCSVNPLTSRGGPPSRLRPATLSGAPRSSLACRCADRQIASERGDQGRLAGVIRTNECNANWVVLLQRRQLLDQVMPPLLTDHLGEFPKYAGGRRGRGGGHARTFCRACRASTGSLLLVADETVSGATWRFSASIACSCSPVPANATSIDDSAHGGLADAEIEPIVGKECRHKLEVTGGCRFLRGCCTA